MRLKLLQIILTTIGWIKAKYISYHWPLHSKYIFLREYIFIIIAEWTIRIYSDGNAYYFSKSYNIWLNYSGIFKNNMVIIFEWIIPRIYLLTSNEYIYIGSEWIIMRIYLLASYELYLLTSNEWLQMNIFDMIKFIRLQ